MINNPAASLPRAASSWVLNPSPRIKPRIKRLTIWLIIHIIINMTFEWDEEKNLDNIAKHNVSFETAQEAFYDRRRIIIKDRKHSKKEERFYCIGNDGYGIITVRFTKRDESIRIFGAGYWRKGRNRYEEENNLH